MPTSPLDNTDGPIGYQIKCSGNILSSELQVTRITVEHSLNRISEAEIAFADGSLAANEFPLIDSDTVKPGTEIEVSCFYGSGERQDLFKGIITSTRFQISRGGPETVIIARDKAIKLAQNRKSAYFEKKKDEEVANQIISEAGLTAAIETVADAQPATAVQNDVSDWDFLRLLADRNGQVIKVDGGTVSLAKPDFDASAKMTTTLGVDVLDLAFEIETAGATSETIVTGWDPAEQETSVGQADALQSIKWGNSTLSDLTEVTGNRKKVVATPYAAGSVDPNSVAKSRADRVAPSIWSGTLSYTGSVLAFPGDNIEILGAGSRFSGTAYVCGIQHRIAAGTWKTTARLGLPERWRADAPGLAGAPAGALASPIHGLQVGKVLSLGDGSESPQADPNMILVSLPLIGDPAAQVFARIAHPYASNEAGIQFLPEIDDEVLVGFLSADPSAPVILGSLHSAKLPRNTEVNDDENNLKSIKTRSGLQVIFDDEKTILTIETPGGHSAILDDDATRITIQDSTGNSIEMSESGIAITSNGTLDITASDAISIKSNTDVSVDGANVDVSANASATVKGNASAEISASGSTTVKGATVMIN